MTDSFVGYINTKHFVAELQGLLSAVKRVIVPIEKAFKSEIMAAADKVQSQLNDEMIRKFIMKSRPQMVRNHQELSSEFLEWQSKSNPWEFLPYIKANPFVGEKHVVAEESWSKMIKEVRVSADRTIAEIKKSGEFRMEAVYSGGLVESIIRVIVFDALSSDNISNMRYGSKYANILEQMIGDLSSATYDNIDVPQSKMEVLAEIRVFLKGMMEVD